MMKKFSKIILMVMVFLFMSQVITNGFAWQKKGNNVGMFNPLEDWTEESEADDVRDDILDLSLNVFQSRLSGSSSGIANSSHTPDYIQGHIQEIIPPPPKS
jgi:hypothetical protein